MGFDPHPDANQLALWLEGGLAERQRQRLLRHLSECEACRSWAVCAQTAGAALPAAAPNLPVPLPLPMRGGFWRWQAPLGVAASAVLVAAVVWRLPAVPAPPPPQPAVRAQALATAPPQARILRPQPAPAAAPPPRSDGMPAAAAPPSLSAAQPSAPAPALQAAVQPQIDFSPLLTGFQDQPMLPMARSALAAWDGETGGGAVAAATPAVAITPDSSAPAASATAWPFASGFASGGVSDQGPLAPSVASGLGWAISRGGEVLRSIGAGLWQTVPLVPGVHFRALTEIGNTIWAGGRADQLFYSPDHGAHWRTVRLPKLGAHPAPLQSISFYDTHHGVVMSQDGRVWITSDGGMTWTAQ